MYCLCTAPLCRESGTTLVAYSPLCQGLLTGKYSRDNRPSGPRAQLFTEARYQSVQVLLDCMRAIAADQPSGPKSLAQVAINWTMCKGALPIPGAKNAKQVGHGAGHLHASRQPAPRAGGSSSPCSNSKIRILHLPACLPLPLPRPSKPACLPPSPWRRWRRLRARWAGG